MCVCDHDPHLGLIWTQYPVPIQCYAKNILLSFWWLKWPLGMEMAFAVSILSLDDPKIRPSAITLQLRSLDFSFPLEPFHYRGARDANVCPLVVYFINYVIRAWQLPFVWFYLRVLWLSTYWWVLMDILCLCRLIFIPEWIRMPWKTITKRLKTEMTLQ